MPLVSCNFIMMCLGVNWRWQCRRTCTHLLQELQNYNSLLNNHQKENVGSHQKKMPHIQGQRTSPSRMVGAAKSRLESNPIPARVSRRAQTNLLCTRTQTETPETELELCLKASCGGMGQQYPAAGAGALGASYLGMAWTLIEEVTINPTRDAKSYIGLRKQTLGGHKQNLVHNRTQEKGAATPQETDPDLSMSVQESPAEAWVSGGLLQGRRHCVHAWDLLNEVTIIFITSTIVWSHDKQGGNTAPPINRKLKIYWAWPSKQDPDSPTAYPSHQNASISLLSLSIRGQTEW